MQRMVLLLLAVALVAMQGSDAFVTPAKRALPASPLHASSVE
eukprot:CAMPEP_0182485194 /NCGR_PEP_ID=MMETSP1319-20130603/44777_1 /TAXON_ID=172717 /ORGANISM="Bolidomonas pacifica, Strain RCC208" /LENGTH=41 /DNA_ID= /DNA_START= /DNA_END= /DNA_ORIENTATION=